MVSRQNFKLIASHLLARIHLSLDGCRRSQDPRSLNPQLAPITGSIRPRHAALISYRLESVGLKAVKKCRC